jgi:5-methylcytosine-specific restriction enzyme subunit McrC
MTLRTLRLTEHRPREVRLRRPDVDALLAAREAVEVVPTREPHRYRLTAQGVAGVLLTPNVRIVIRPKIPKANLYLLLDPDAPPDVIADMSAAESGTEAIDFLARRLAREMRARTAGGLPRGYVERADQQPFLQGRLDVAAQARESPAGRTQFHVTREEFTTDTTVNRLIKATAEAMSPSPLVSPAVRNMLPSAIAGYADVTSVHLDPAALDALPFGRDSESDRPLIDLCRLLARGLQPGEPAGNVVGPAFLLDLEHLFERYVERGLRAHLAAGALQTQHEFIYHRPAPAGQPAITGRPDFVMRREETVACVMDAKWKALDGPPPAADIHQALAYATGLGCRDVRLVYPGRRGAAWRYVLAESAVTLTVHTLRVVGPREKCERSLRRLARGLR